MTASDLDLLRDLRAAHQQRCEVLAGEAKESDAAMEAYRLELQRTEALDRVIARFETEASR